MISNVGEIFLAATHIYFISNVSSKWNTFSFFGVLHEITILSILGDLIHPQKMHVFQLNKTVGMLIKHPTIHFVHIFDYFHALS